MLPPTPREVALAWIAVRLYPINDDATPRYPYSAVYTAGVLELIIGEIVELNILISRERKLLDAAAHPDEAEDLGQWSSDFFEAFREPGDGCAVIDALELQIRDRVSEKHADEDLADIIEPIERRSPLGLFLRRISLSIRRLDLAETELLSRQVADWCGHASSSRPVGVHVADETGTRREDAFREYRKAMSQNDFYLAKEAVRRFNDYSLPTQQGQHQHALLNLAATHFEEGLYPLAKKTVDEAVRIARSHGDRACLDHCVRLVERIEKAQKQERERKRREDDPPEDYPEVVTVSHRLKAHAMELPTTASPLTSMPVKPLPRWHVDQAELWHKLGSSSLQELHLDLAAESGNAESDPYVEVLLQDAQQLAQQGHHDAALSMLIQVDNTRIDMRGYQAWAAAVNAILENRSEKAMLPANTDSQAVSLARDVVETLHQGAPTPAVMKRAILAFELARRDERWDEYATANVVVAYCLIRIDMAPRALELIQSVWDTVLRIGDADTTALGEMVMGKVELERAFKSDAKDYATATAKITRATELAKQARWSRLYEEGELFLYLIAQQQGRERVRAELPACTDTEDIKEIVNLTMRKVMGLDAQ